MITPEKALQVVCRYVRPLGLTTVPLEKALGLRLGENVKADRDMPPADRSAMDGYALRAADLDAPAKPLRLIGEVPAGSPARVKVKAGTCVRIFTGANVPPGADTVVMVEQTEERDGLVTFRGKITPGSNIMRRGEDAKKGSVLLEKGVELGPFRLGVCAAVGKAEVKVFRKPRIALICTGEELRDVREKVKPHELRNSNGPTLSAALAHWGFSDVSSSIVPDNITKLVSRLKRALSSADAVLLTGGVSVGKYDYVPEALKRIGAAIRFHRVAMKPGKPVLFATLPGKRYVFALPGNPLSAMVGFIEFALPGLQIMSGVAPEQARPVIRVRLTAPVSSKGDRIRFTLARLLWLEEGVAVEPLPSQSSSDVPAGGRADGVIVIPARVKLIKAGNNVEFHLWRRLP